MRKFVKFNHFIEGEQMYLAVNLSILTKFTAKYWSALFMLQNATKCYILRTHRFLNH